MDALVSGLVVVLMEVRAWIVMFGLLVLVGIGLGTIGLWWWGAAIVLLWFGFAIVWAFWLGDLVVPKMPRCPDCRSYRRGYRWIGMRQYLEAGTLGRLSSGWGLREIDREVSVPVVLPDVNGSVLVCKCPLYWFRDTATWTVYSLSAREPPHIYAVREWGRWTSVSEARTTH